MNTPELITEQRKQLQSWLAEWRLERALIEPDEIIAESWTPQVDFSGEPSPAPGQIRLWPPRAAEDGPCYGLLLACGYGRWRVLPFSGFNTPATPLEWQLRSESPLRVLQIWNLREIHGSGAAASWCADMIPEELLFPLTAFLTATKAGETSLDRSAGDKNTGKTGPPLLHPLDPRHEYMELEYERVHRTLGEFEAAAEPASGVDLAAEPPPDFDD